MSLCPSSYVSLSPSLSCLPPLILCSEQLGSKLYIWELNFDYVTNQLFDFVYSFIFTAEKKRFIRRESTLADVKAGLSERSVARKDLFNFKGKRHIFMFPGRIKKVNAMPQSVHVISWSRLQFRWNFVTTKLWWEYGNRRPHKNCFLKISGKEKEISMKRTKPYKNISKKRCMLCIGNPLH